MATYIITKVYEVEAEDEAEARKLLRFAEEENRAWLYVQRERVQVKVKSWVRIVREQLLGA